MARKIMILAGAPDSNTIDWKEATLLDRFLDPIAEFACMETVPEPGSTATDPKSTLDIAVWRSISLKKERLQTGFSQLHELDGIYHGNNDFFTALPTTMHTYTESMEHEPSQSQSQRLLDRFYDHSLAIHDDIPSSQLPTLSLSNQGSSLDTTAADTTAADTTAADTTAADTTENLTQSGSSLAERHQYLAVDAALLSDLEDIPNASYLQAISPQTMTVNLIVGIISIAEPRTVKTRWGSTKSLVELLVGDETKSGFSVTFWLSSEANDASGSTLRDLRRQDIVLLRNVALGVFNKKVHGHNLRKGLTRVDLLHRRKLDKDGENGLYSMRNITSAKAAHPQLLKARKVREWVMNFVGGGGTGLEKRKRGGRPVRTWDMPPPDTQ